ncbi:MAG: 2-oxoacid:acceptor oxidoreductase family protein [Syntrophobacteraceae bacterium]
MAETRDSYEVVMAGSGGQGLIVSGIMLGEAAMLEGKNVVQTQSYGIASRGGFSQAEVIIDKGEIIFQQVQKPDIALAFTEEAMEKYLPLAESGAPVFYDTSLLKVRTGKNLYGFPFTEMGGKLGHVGTANMIALGAMSALTGVVSVESLARVIGRRFSGKTAELNIKALQAGAALTRAGAGQRLPDHQHREETSAAESTPHAGSAAAEGAGSRGKGEFNVTVNFSVCKQCGYCREVCNKDVFDISDSYNPSGYRPMTAARSDNCAGCLSCLMVCPDFAVSIEPTSPHASYESPHSEDQRKENAS